MFKLLRIKNLIDDKIIDLKTLILITIKGLNPCIDCGGGASQAPSQKKASENGYRVEMQIHRPIFQGQFIEKEIRFIAFIVGSYGRIKKMQKIFKQMLKLFFV